MITISALHYQWRTPEEAFERALDEFGLDGIEFSVLEGAGRPHVLETEYSTIARLAATRAVLLSAHVWGDLGRLGDQAAGQLRSWLGTAKRLHLCYLVVHGGTHDDRAAGLAQVTAALAEVADDYLAAGVTLCLENHYDWDYHDCHELFSTAEEFAGLFERIPSRGVGFCLDYGHSHMTGNTQELLECVGHRLAYTHLADNRGEDDDHLAFGEGTVPWAEVLAATRATGYPGPFTIEFPVRGRDDPALRKCLEMLREA